MTPELSPSQAAARIGTTTRTVQRWIANGILPARRVGGRWRVASDALDAFETGESAATQPTAAVVTAPIATLFVANRGEIADRIRHTAERLGIRTVVPGRDGAPAVDLLDVDAVVGAARAAHADALHPGYGFLSESADFAAAVEAVGIRWVGPTSDAIRALGDKAAARRLAASLDVPTLPGYDDPDQSDRVLTAAATKIGFPLLVKPSAGGGGKGMRVVREASHLSDALASARREALTAFGDDRLVLERYLEGPRHIEIQVLFDHHGSGVHLGERDCSLQRRNQKVLEETPAPGLASAVRERMTGAALRLASAVGYRSAGTCEFLLDDRGRFYFLEMNTRLQVEHPVTEAVTGRDLVADQLAIAAGATLGSLALEQPIIDAAIESGGHAVEVRLYAEDADDGFLPATGRVELLRWPASATAFEPAGRAGIRIDSGIETGTVVGPRFDPMLAKIVAHGADRIEALAGLSAALDETVVLGLITNVRFLRWLVREPFVTGGLIRTDTLGRVWPPDDWAAATAIPSSAWTAAARLLASPPAEETGPFDGGWRLNGPARVRLIAEGREVAVTLPPTETDDGSGEVDAFRVGPNVHVDVAGRSVAFEIAPPPDIDQAVRAAATRGPAGAISQIVAPMPGAVLTVHRAVGDVVEAGEPIVTLEAMKMEHIVGSPGAGRITEILVHPADQVVRGQRLAVIEP